MTTDEKIEIIQTILQNDAEATEGTLTHYMRLAEIEILNRMYPFGAPDDAVVPSRYDNIECQLVAQMFSRRGALGETAHNENGINRTYVDAHDEALLSKIVPKAKVI